MISYHCGTCSPSASTGIGVLIVDRPWLFLPRGYVGSGNIYSVVFFLPPVEICWSLGIFSLYDEGRGRSEWKRVGRLINFLRWKRLFRTRRLSIRFLFTFCHGAPLFSPSLLCLSVLLGDSREGLLGRYKAAHRGREREGGRERAFATTPVYLKGKFAPRDCSYRWLIDRASFSF